MTGLASALADFTTVWTETGGIITGNSVLMTFLAGSLLILGFKVFKKARKSVRQGVFI